MTGTDDDRVPGRGTERPGRRRRGGARRPAAGMRWSIARLALAVTSMVALAFAVPLGMLAQHVARDRAISDARAQAASLVAVLAVTERRTALAHAIAATAPGSAGRLAVDLPGQPPVGHPHARGADVAVARYRRESVTADAAHGLTYLQPVVLSGDRTAVIEVYLPAGQLTRGVWTAWLAIAAVVVLLVAGSVLVADRLGARLVAAARALADGARRFGAEDLSSRVRPAGPAELVEAGTTFNAMADRMSRFVAAERQLAGDLSHRLRTPLTALRLDAERLPAGPVGERITDAVRALEDEVDAIIVGAGRGSDERSADRTDLVDVLADRLAFWAVLAADHDRHVEVVGAERRLLVPVSRDELIAAVDSLLGNVFEHTPQGTPFRVTVTDTALVVEDAGPGIADPAAALRRGVSGTGSTGVGLPIVRRVADALGGTVGIDRGDLGGARVTLTLGPAGTPAPVPHRRGRRGR